MNTFKIVLLACLVSLFGCKKETKEEAAANDDKLTLQRTNYTGNELRINGYYYNVLNGSFYDLKFFYKNGVVKNIGSPSVATTLPEVDNYVSAVTTEVMNRKRGWGGVHY